MSAHEKRHLANRPTRKVAAATVANSAQSTVNNAPVLVDATGQAQTGRASG
jgi:hypothetical protein